MEHWWNLDCKDLTGIVDGILYKETWKPVDNFPNYLVSSFGRVKAISRVKTNEFGSFIIKEKIIKQCAQSGGYLRVSLCNESGIYTKLIHIITASHFIENPLNLPEVNHIKGIKTDNRFHQLEWISKSNNMKHAVRIGLLKMPRGEDNFMYGRKEGLHHLSKKINQYDSSGKFIKEYDSLKQANRLTGLPQQNICKVLKGERQSCGGFNWKYSQ